LKRFNLTILILVLTMASCSDGWKKVAVSTGIGCGTGLAFGALYDEMQRAKDGKERKKLENQIFNVFKKRKEQNKGKVVGLATGCLAGLGVGLYLKMMKEDIQENFGSRGIFLEDVTDKNGELSALRVRMDGDISFENGRADLQGVGRENVLKLAEALSAYPETQVAISGHANRTGSESTNLRLSRERADEVVSTLTANGVTRARIVSSEGKGSSTPMGGLSPTDGRNRRVEVLILPQS